MCWSKSRLGNHRKPPKGIESRTLPCPELEETFIIRLYWCRGKGRDDPKQRNFGDYLSPLIVEMASGQEVRYAPIHKADMMAVGSIMDRERKATRFLMPRRLHVWGTGTSAPGCRFSERHFYHAVRGVKTLEQLGGYKTIPALGDPGLLASYWWEGRERPRKRYRVGLIPHYVDRAHRIVAHFNTFAGVRVIDVFWPIEEVLRTIQECDFILSSSMHGLIVSDSFGVPNRRIRLSSGLISEYKFVDYYSVFGIFPPDPLDENDAAKLDFGKPELWIGDYVRPNLKSICDALLLSFPNL